MISLLLNTYMRLARFINYKVHLRSLSQIFREADNNAQTRALDIFYRSKSLIDFHAALDHIYKEATHDSDVLYELPKLIGEMRLVPDNQQYVKLFSVKTLPVISDSQILKQCYVETVLQLGGNLSEGEVFNIYSNLNSLVQEDQKSDVFARFEDKNVSLLFEKVLDSFVDKLPLFQSNVKYKMLLLSKSLKVYNPQFANYFKFFFLNNYREFSMIQCLTILSYLSDNRTFPHNFFYQMKDRWMDIIVPSPILLEKSESCLLKMFQIISKQKLFYCSKLAQQIITLIHRNINHFDATDLIRTLFYYSKDRFRFEDDDLVNQVVKHLEPKIDEVTNKQMRLLLMSLGRLKFQQIEFIKKVKTNKHFFDAIKANESGKEEAYFVYLSQILSD